MAEIPVLLLAAGASRRMGQPKQLLPWGGNTLIEHQVHSLKKIQNPVFVVLGSNSGLIAPLLEKLRVNIIINDNWEKGMGNSISCGMGAVVNELKSPAGVLITLLDQPLIPVGHYERMISLFSQGFQQIIVSGSKSGWKGVPALFDSYYFEELTRLDGDSGAKKIIENNPEKITAIPCKECLEDIDTPESYRKILEKYLKLTRAGYFR
jgi:molybdenum cofactor cytidylyltransferase